MAGTGLTDSAAARRYPVAGSVERLRRHRRHGNLDRQVGPSARAEVVYGRRAGVAGCRAWRLRCAGGGMIASRRTITETPTPRNGSANSGPFDRMPSPRPTRTPPARRALRQPETRPGPVSPLHRRMPGECDGDRRHLSAVVGTRVLIAMPGVWGDPGRRARTSSGTSARGRRYDRHAGRPHGAILGTPTLVPGTTTRQNLDGQVGRQGSHPRGSHRSNGGRQRITARRRSLCTCCGAVTAGCSMRT
jgi:hypothetical protein